MHEVRVLVVEVDLAVAGSPARTVVFDHSQGAAFDATPLWKLLDGEHTGDVLYRPFFKFMEV